MQMSTSHGTDPEGEIFEDDIGQRHGDVDEYSKLAIKTDTCWQNVEQQKTMI
jgi:hypothetical protein